jgi:NAD(P)-dependent dehydrogenase (short-subunit alcohol dehydrogenase family)
VVSDRVALVTGSSRGIGRATAVKLAQDGFTVVVNHPTNADGPAETLEAVAAAGGRGRAIKADVSSVAEITAMFDTIRSEFGRLDVLVNNAGMSPVYDGEAAVTEALFDKVLDVNLKGPFRLTALVGTRMAEGDGGSIINITSVGAVHPRPGILPYAAAKAGLNALTTGFAHAFGPKVRVNAIMAGTFLTDVSKAWDMTAFEKRAQGFALKRGGRPEEIVGAALYLASDLSSYTTGSILTVDGGQP